MWIRSLLRRVWMCKRYGPRRYPVCAWAVMLHNGLEATVEECRDQLLRGPLPRCLFRSTFFLVVGVGSTFFIFGSPFDKDCVDQVAQADTQLTYENSTCEELRSQCSHRDVVRKGSKGASKTRLNMMEAMKRERDLMR